MARAATHAKKEATAFEKVLDVIKMAQAAKTEADLYKATQMKHAELKKDYADLDSQHKTKSAQLETERAQMKAAMDSDLRSYALGLEGDLKSARAAHDAKMGEMQGERSMLAGDIETMEIVKQELAEALTSLRSEAKAHAEKAIAAAAGGA